MGHCGVVAFAQHQQCGHILRDGGGDAFIGFAVGSQDHHVKQSAFRRLRHEPHQIEFVEVGDGKNRFAGGFAEPCGSIARHEIAVRGKFQLIACRGSDFHCAKRVIRELQQPVAIDGKLGLPG